MGQKGFCRIPAFSASWARVPGCDDIRDKRKSARLSDEVFISAPTSRSRPGPPYLPFEQVHPLVVIKRARSRAESHLHRGYRIDGLCAVKTS